jgi:hypothetical protein
MAILGPLVQGLTLIVHPGSTSDQKTPHPSDTTSGLLDHVSLIVSEKQRHRVAQEMHFCEQNEQVPLVTVGSLLKGI